MRRTWLNAAAAAGIALGAGAASAQPGGPGGGSDGGGFGRRDRGGFGGGTPDPNAIWQMMARGDAQSINLNERPDIRESMLRRGTPIPADGILTKEAFVTSFQQRMAQGGFGGRGGPPGGGSPGGFGGSPGGGFGTPPGGGNGFDSSALSDDQIRLMMRRYDTNGDGRVSADEAANSERLKPVFQQYDRNGDGALDAAEYRGYIQDRFSSGSRGPGGGGPGGPPTASVAPGGPPTAPPAGSVAPPQPQYDSRRDDRRRDDRREEEPDDPRPVVHRFGKLPKELPSWFEKLDTDQDGQVGLYEWRAADRPTAEFVEMDANGDGYLIAEEWLRFTKLAQEKKPDAADSESGDAASADGRSRPAAGGGGANPFGGRGGPGGDSRGGRGGPPGGGDSRGGRDRPGGNRGR